MAIVQLLTLRLVVASVELPVRQLAMRSVAAMAPSLEGLSEARLEWLLTQRMVHVTILLHGNQIQNKNTNTDETTEDIRTITIVRRVRGKKAAANLNKVSLNE